MKEYKVVFWHQDEDGRQDYMEFDTMEQAKLFYDSLNGKAEIRKYIEDRREYEVVVYPEFEF